MQAKHFHVGRWSGSHTATVFMGLTIDIAKESGNIYDNLQAKTKYRLEGFNFVFGS
jgi:hypothetical protein